MKFKLVLQVLAVCCSVTLLGAYVVYAQRRAQPFAPETTAENAPASPENAAPESEGQIVEFEGFIQYPPPSQPGETDPRPTMAASSKSMVVFTPSSSDRPNFRGQSLNLIPREPAPPQRNSVAASPSNPGPSGSVTQRSDGSTVTSRVFEEKATFAPSSKVMIFRDFSSHFKKDAQDTPSQPLQINGKFIKPETIRHSESPKFITVVQPLAAPKESAPAPTIATQTFPQPTTPTAPRETIIFSTKSAPVFVAPRPVPTTPAPIAPTQTTRVPAPPTQTQQTESPKPRFLAPGSKSIDLLLLEKTRTPQPAQKVSPAAPAQTPAQPRTP